MTSGRTVASKDGTRIAFDVAGTGPALILIGGMFEYRAWESETSRLATHPLLLEHFSVVHYDRRGRGESGDTPPYAVAREVDDLAALIDDVGGSAFLSGISSGAALAFEGALALGGGKVAALALFEPPYSGDPEDREGSRAFAAELDATLAEGRHDDAVALFIASFGASPEELEELRRDPLWQFWEAVAPTMAYEVTVVGRDGSVPADRARGIAVPTLVMAGSESFPFMQSTARTLADAIPGARLRVLDGQTHQVEPEALAPALVEFFESGR